MASSDNSFTDNLSAVDRIYKTHSGLDEDLGHIDVENDARPGADEDGFGGDAPDPETDPEDLTEEELEELTDPDGEEDEQ